MDIQKKLQPLADAIKQGKKITVFQGAGVSTGAGIPDFRSPETGLYSNLAKLNLPYAEAVFDIEYFRDHPRAFYTLAEELYPGKFQPTSFHYLIRLLQDNKVLNRVYTQNIDTLERVAGVEDEYIVEAHGSFANNHCIDCGHEMSIETVKSFMARKDIPICSKPDCEGYVKPDIVFFGEALPVRFFETWDEDCDDVEFGLVAGTSLTVFPFASLPAELSYKVPRVLINREVVGDFKNNRKRKQDVIIEDDCDSVALELCRLLGWEEELNRLRLGKAKFGVELEIDKITEDMKGVLGKEKDEKGKDEEKDEKENVDTKSEKSSESKPLEDKPKTETDPDESNPDESKPSNPSNPKDETSTVNKILNKFTNMKI